MASLTNCGTLSAIKIANAKEDFGKDLCNAANADFPAWRNRLREYLRKSNIRIEVLDTFPDPRIIHLYNKPLVSSEKIISNIGKFWNPSFNEMGLQKLIAPRFNFWVNEYIRDIIPILLIRSLASTQPGQEASNNCYKLHVKTKKKTPVLRKNVEVLLSAVTSMDIPAWKAEFTKVFQEEEVLPVDEMVECKDLLSCIIDHGIEKALLPNTPSYEHDRNIVSPEMMFKNKKRAGSIVPNKASSSSQEQPPSKRVKSIPGQSSRSTPPSKALMEPVSPHHTEITFQPRKTSSSTKKTPIRDIPEVARDRMSPEQRRESESEKHPRQRDVKKSSVLTIDLMLDDSDEENPIPVTSAQTHTSKSSSSQTSPTSTNREARFRHFGSDMRKQASISTAQQSSFGASPNSRIESQSSPLAKKSLPQGMKEEDFDGFFFSVFDELMGLRGYSLLSCPGNFIP